MKHIFAIALPVAVNMLCVIAYQVIDIYFIAQLGPSAVSGVAAVGSAAFFVAACAQVLGAGTVALIAQACGRREYQEANLTLNQALMMSAGLGVVTFSLLTATIEEYLRFVTADKSTVDAGVEFARSVLPGYVALLPMTVLSSALRGAGAVWSAISFHVLTVVMNAILAPVLIAGWGSGLPLGVAGAGMATSIGVVCGVLAMAAHIHLTQCNLRFSWGLMRPQLGGWRRILSIGLPAGGELALMVLFPAVVLYAIRQFGASAQGGYSLGLRIAQAIIVPGLSISAAVAPIVGQNVGAVIATRVIEVFRKATIVGSAIMIATTVLVYVGSKELVSIFGADSRTRDVAVIFLQVTSLAFVAQGIVYTSSALFQGLGNTRPSLIGSGASFFLFTVAAVWLSVRPGFRLESVWYLMVAVLTIQALLCLWLVRMELRRRLLF